jgi:hypothetical protein
MTEPFGTNVDFYRSEYILFGSVIFVSQDES